MSRTLDTFVVLALAPSSRSSALFSAVLLDGCDVSGYVIGALVDLSCNRISAAEARERKVLENYAEQTGEANT